jgi:hypothetical protein
MEYGRREPMKSESAREPTSFTMKTIQELLAEEQEAFSEAVTTRQPLPEKHLQQPPHMCGAAPEPKCAESAAASEPKACAAPELDAEKTATPTPVRTMEPKPVQAQPVAKSRSFFGRIIGA